jgi:nicotinamide-nucleotide adenylyltransferase
MSKTRGILIGRFQPFHNGHRQLVAEIAADVDELILGIGSADASHTKRNPFTAGERIMMMRHVLELMDLDITSYTVPIEDLERNSVWVSHVQSMSPRFDIAYSNNPLVIRVFEEAGVEVRQTEMFDREDLKGSAIRDQMIEGEEWVQYVPDPAVEIIEEVEGVQRIRAVS